MVGKENNHRRFSRTGLLAALCAASLAWAAAVAATPPSGSLSGSGDAVTWEGGPLTAVNPTPSTCVEGVSCDTFTLDLAIAANQVASVRFRIDWVNNLNDFDLFIFDEQGNEVDNSGAGSTEFEEVTIGNLPAGTYSVVTNAFSTVNASYSGLAQLVSLTDVTPPPPPDLDNTIRFSNTIVDFSGVSGEPFIRTDNFGDSYVSVPFGFSTTHSLLWKSIDGTRSYIALGSPVTRDAVAGLGGGDTHQDFDANNFLYYVDLSAVCVTAAVSTDGGNTFDPLRNNQVTCVSEENPTAAGDDRQWVSAFGQGIAYATWRNLTFGDFWLFKTADGGLSWDGGRSLGTVTQSGPVQTDKTLRTVNVQGVDRQAILTYQIFYRGNDVRVFRVTDFNDGSPLLVDDLLAADRDLSVGNVFPILSLDTAGNLYAVWSEGAGQIYLTTSTDRGQTWSVPVKVGTGSGTNIMPWIKAGDPGRVSIVWYHSPLAGNPNVPESVWDIYMAQTLNALDAAPAFTTHQVNHTRIHFAEICLRGLGCNLSVPMGDRSFLEFPSIDVDLDGAAVITYNDNTNQAAAPYVMVAKQLNGPSLYAAVGSVDETDPGTVTVAQPSEGQVIDASPLSSSGSHSLPPANFDRDELGDARFPDHGPVIGDNIPALDIRCVTIEEDGDFLKVTMEIADLTLPALAAAPALSGGDGVLYLTQWDFNHDVFWVAAEVRGGVPLFHTGSLGVVTSGTSKKYITYNPNLQDSLQVQGSIENAAPGRVTMRLPRSLAGNPADGQTVFHATGYAMSQRGPLVPVQSGEPGEEGVPNPSSFPIKVDASGGFTYTLGDGLRQDGTVELSLDDPTFASSFPPDSLGGCNPVWQAAVDVSGLSAGQHTLCARQTITDRDPSPAACVNFVIPGSTGSQGRVHGSGYLETNPQSGGNDKKLNFNFEAGFKDGVLTGKLQVNDKGAGVRIEVGKDGITSLSAGDGPCNGVAPGSNTFEFTAVGQFNGTPDASFRVCGQDNGVHGQGDGSQPPDRFFVECTSGCDYNSAARTPDDGLDGGNIHIHDPIAAADGSSSSGSSPSEGQDILDELELQPLLLTEGVSGSPLLLTAVARAYDGSLAQGRTVTLTVTRQDGSTENLTQLADAAGVAVFVTSVQAGETLYLAQSGELQSNGIAITGLSPE